MDNLKTVAIFFLIVCQYMVTNMQVLTYLYTVYGKILEGLNIGEWADLNQLAGKIMVNELHV